MYEYFSASCTNQLRLAVRIIPAQAIIEYLNKNGAYAVKSIVTNRSGSPDIICCFNGLFVALEVKTEKGIISKLQEYHQKEILKSGGIALIVRSIEEVKALIEKLKAK